MFKVEQFDAESSPGVRNEEPFIRASGTSGEGCPCGCSPGFWISLGVEGQGIKVQFDSKEEYLACVEGR